VLLEFLSFSHSAEQLRAHNDRLNRDASRGALVGLKTRLTTRPAQLNLRTKALTTPLTTTVTPPTVSLAAR
jgi:hypothetical protein